MSTVEFDPSLLGTKAHWDQRYAEELAHFHDSGLEGEVWYVVFQSILFRSPTRARVIVARFGEEPVENMVAWAATHVPPTARPNVLDVGTGNGHLLFSLIEAGYDPSRLMGIDYSQGSVDLATAIAKQRDVDDAAYASVTFAVCDFLDPTSPIPPPGREATSDSVWDLVLDKGTFDAMSLMYTDERGIAPLEEYVPRVVSLLRPGGHFLITSCNFTEDELIQNIGTRSGLEYRAGIPYKKFTFGGKVGSSYATVAFQKSLD